ncbi:MAG TPA: hypothetical protein VNN13_03755 [Methylomirabilota bacterium]|nr:hypothetical protein [Methylomirabilota bacterium]
MSEKTYAADRRNIVGKLKRGGPRVASDSLDDPIQVFFVFGRQIFRLAGAVVRSRRGDQAGRSWLFQGVIVK